MQYCSIQLFRKLLAHMCTATFMDLELSVLVPLMRHVTMSGSSGLSCCACLSCCADLEVYEQAQDSSQRMPSQCAVHACCCWHRRCK